MSSTILRLAAGLLLLGGLFYFGLIDLGVLRTALHYPATLAFATFVSLLAIPTAAFRWQLLLRSQALNLRLVDTVRIAAISTFFGTFLPGAVGGDIIRIVYIHRASFGRRTGAYMSILVDRLIGFAALMIYGIVVTLCRPSGGYHSLEYALLLFASGFVTSIAIVLVLGDRALRIINALFTGRWHKIAEMIERVALALRQYRLAWPALAYSLGVSILVSGMQIGAIVIIAVFMNFGGLSTADYTIAAAYGLMVNNVPLTPGGLGVGESAFASLCVALGGVASVPYGTIFLLFRCVLMISVLPGLLVYLIYPDRARLLEKVDTVGRD
ncbi:MAG: flippase-like domain-containing protein [Proteobacteria bacterium]|nr:flippase-like domain-containing protein [Pseudomonadota bacterium]